MATFWVRLEEREPDHELIRELSVDLDPDADGIEIVRAAEKLGERLGLTGFTVTVVRAGAVVGDASIAPDAQAVAEVLPDRTVDLTAAPSIQWSEWRKARRSIEPGDTPTRPRRGRVRRKTSASAMNLIGEMKPL